MFNAFNLEYNKVAAIYDKLQALVHKYKDHGQKYEIINISDFINIIGYFIDNFVDNSNVHVRRKRSLSRISKESLRIISRFKNEIEKSKENGESHFVHKEVFYREIDTLFREGKLEQGFIDTLLDIVSEVITLNRPDLKNKIPELTQILNYISTFNLDELEKEFYSEISKYFDMEILPINRQRLRSQTNNLQGNNPLEQARGIKHKMTQKGRKVSKPKLENDLQSSINANEQLEIHEIESQGSSKDINLSELEKEEEVFQDLSIKDNVVNNLDSTDEQDTIRPLIPQESIPSPNLEDFIIPPNNQQSTPIKYVPPISPNFSPIDQGPPQGPPITENQVNSENSVYSIIRMFGENFSNALANMGSVIFTDEEHLNNINLEEKEYKKEILLLNKEKGKEHNEIHKDTIEPMQVDLEEGEIIDSDDSLKENKELGDDHNEKLGMEQKEENFNDQVKNEIKQKIEIGKSDPLDILEQRLSLNAETFDKIFLLLEDNSMNPDYLTHLDKIKDYVLNNKNSKAREYFFKKLVIIGEMILDFFAKLDRKISVMHLLHAQRLPNIGTRVEIYKQKEYLYYYPLPSSTFYLFSAIPHCYETTCVEAKPKRLIFSKMFTFQDEQIQYCSSNKKVLDSNNKEVYLCTDLEDLSNCQLNCNELHNCNYKHTSYYPVKLGYYQLQYTCNPLKSAVKTQCFYERFKSNPGSIFERLIDVLLNKQAFAENFLELNKKYLAHAITENSKNFLLSNGFNILIAFSSLSTIGLFGLAISKILLSKKQKERKRRIWVRKTLAEKTLNHEILESNRRQDLKHVKILEKLDSIPLK